MVKNNWPTFFIVGAPRSGTTSLYNYLKMIPGVFMSPVKEPGYFIPNDFRGFTEKSYLELFKDVKNEKAVGEASAGYLANPDTPKQIKEKIPYAKIIITLRDPVQRIFSHYLNKVRTGDTKIPFDKAVNDYLNGTKNDGYLEELIEVSLYYVQVKRYLEIFGENNVKILVFEEVVKDTKGSMKEVLKFLGINSAVPKNIEEQYNSFSEPLGTLGTSIANSNTISNMAKRILPNSNRESILRTILNKKGKKPKISKESRSKLQELFKDDVKKLEKLLNRSFAWKTVME